jgi:hypothetical protein
MPQPNNAGDGCQGSPVRGSPQARAEGAILTAGGRCCGRVGAPRTPPREALSIRSGSCEGTQRRAGRTGSDNYFGRPGGAQVATALARQSRFWRDEQVARRSGCSALLSERHGHPWPVVAAGSCGERQPGRECRSGGRTRTGRDDRQSRNTSRRVPLPRLSWLSAAVRDQRGDAAHAALRRSRAPSRRSAVQAPSALAHSCWTAHTPRKPAPEKPGRR